MVVVGADVHKRTHTFVAVDEVGRKLGEKTVTATTDGHAEAVMWARERFGTEVVWAYRGLPASVGAPGARPARCRAEGGAGAAEVDGPDPGQSARTRGKSDPIDALAVARAVLARTRPAGGLP